MIAATAYQKFVPRGWQQVKQHPGEVVLPSTQPQLHPESYLLHCFSKFAISGSSKSREFWMIRASPNGNGECEDELYVKGKLVVWSRGVAPNTSSDGKDSRVVLSCYTCESPVQYALWCTFYSSALDKPILESDTIFIPTSTRKVTEPPLSCVCIVDSDNIKVFTEDGEDYVSPLQFQVSSIWAIKYGIILERALSSKGKINSPFSGFNHSADADQLPYVFALLHPLDEISPVMAQQCSGKLTYMNNASQRIVFTNENPSICMTYDNATELHSIWKIRKVSKEECEYACGFGSNSSTWSNLPTAASSSGAEECEETSSFQKPCVVGFMSSKAQSDGKASLYPPSCDLLSPNMPNIHSVNKPHTQTSSATSWRTGKSLHYQESRGPPLRPGTPPIDSRIMTSHVNESEMEIKPLFPDLCLEHLWDENRGVPLHLMNEQAQEVFLSTDQVGNKYICYLVYCRKKLFFVRIMKTNNQQQLIFGIESTISATNAVPIPNLNMVAVLNGTGSVILYSGTHVIGKIYLAGVASGFTTSSYLNFNLGLRYDSPIPNLNLIPSSSLLSSSCLKIGTKPTFEESMHQLSPISVESGTTAPQPVASKTCGDHSTPRQGPITHMRDGVGNKITLEFGDGSLFRVTLPELCTSPLVTSCLHTLRKVLQRELAMDMMVKWYKVRNGPGTKEMSQVQEWHLFLKVILALMGYKSETLRMMDQFEAQLPRSPQFLPKRRRSSRSGTGEDWEFLLQTLQHINISQNMTALLGLDTINSTSSGFGYLNQGQVGSSALLYPCIPLILFSLHLTYEDLKLNMLLTENLSMLAVFLHQLAIDLHLEDFAFHYWKDFPTFCTLCTTQEAQQLKFNKLHIPIFLLREPPNIFQHIYNMMKETEVTPFPYISGINEKSKNIIQLTALLIKGSKNPQLQLQPFVEPIIPTGCEGDPQEFLSAVDTASSSKYPWHERAVLLMAEMGITQEDLLRLPAGVSIILFGALYRCRANPPLDWAEAAYHLIMRPDLAAQINLSQSCNGVSRKWNSLSPLHSPAFEADMSGGLKKTPPPRQPGWEDVDSFDNLDVEVRNLLFSKRQHIAELYSLEYSMSSRMNVLQCPEIQKLLFNEDLRIAEVQQLLQSSEPVGVDIVQRPEVSDHEFIEEQERHLYAVCTRTMALPVGRGMFSLRTCPTVSTETLPVPRLCMSGRAPPRGISIELSHIEVVPNMTLWPLFHNGVASGLRIVPNAPNVDSAWIVSNKPKGISEIPPEHAGFLMALGLNGYLKNLVSFNTYEYLIKVHEMTSVGLLLGIAATMRGTMDMGATKMMSIHIEALLPPTSIELDIPQNIQVAALLGVGLIYEGTAHRHITEVLLSEIGRPPGPEMENSVDRESYSLAAGLALGLVVLAKGSKLSGLGDLQVPDTLHYYMVGGHRRPLTGSQKDKYKSPSYQIREGDSVNIDVTSPGATLALGMMYFNSGNKAVADWMQAPDTQYLLDFVRPDFLMLRIIARALILWDDIMPSSSWVESNLPRTIRPFCLVKPKENVQENVDYETMNQAYCNVLAGACMAVGLRFAGSGNNEAFQTLLKYTKMFTSLTGKSIAELAGKSTIETCLNVILLSLSMVMAGTGNVEVIRLCRFLRSRVGIVNSVVTYGSHLATHMALGLLFLGNGRYTLSTSPSAIAAMICAFFPKFPTHSNDNRYHLQAFRHLYMLAIEPRLIITKDIDTGQYCYTHLTVVYLNTPHYEDQWVKLRAPCILPELNKLQEVRVEDDRYWSVVFHRDKNWGQLESLLQNCETLSVKQKAGCLSYIDDPLGFHSLLAQMLTADTVTAWSVPAESVYYTFSSDRSTINFSQLFLGEGEITTRKEDAVIQLLSMMAYECMSQDKLGILFNWISIFKTLQSMKSEPSVFLTWQLKLLSTYALFKNDHETILNTDCSNPIMITSDMALSIQQSVNLLMDSWEPDMIPFLKQYLIGQLSGSSNTFSQLASYLTFYDMPSPYKLFSALKGEKNPINICIICFDNKLIPTVIDKIIHILNYP